MNGMKENILAKLLEFFSKLEGEKEPSEMPEGDEKEMPLAEGKDPKSGKIEMLSLEAEPKDKMPMKGM